MFLFFTEKNTDEKTVRKSAKCWQFSIKHLRSENCREECIAQISSRAFKWASCLCFRYRYGWEQAVRSFRKFGRPPEEIQGLLSSWFIFSLSVIRACSWCSALGKQLRAWLESNWIVFFHRARMEEARKYFSTAQMRSDWAAIQARKPAGQVSQWMKW